MDLRQASYRDITLSISPRSTVFPGDPPVSIEAFSSIQEHGCTTSQMQLSLHTGTHLDAPRHLFDAGETVDQIPLDVLIGPAQLFDFGDVRYGLGAGDLQSQWAEGTRRALIKTGASRRLKEHGFCEDFGYLQTDAAEFLVRSGVQLVGIDSLSIDGFNAADLPVHRLLLAAGVVIVEALDLQDVSQGAYELICLPIKVEADGAPVRAALVH